MNKGILLINLGTPDESTTLAVRRYLREFLADPRVIDIPWFFRQLLLYLVILPFRSSKSAAAYQKIWTNEGSPLAVHTRNLQNKLAKLLPDVQVEYAMRYQNPSLASALKKFKSSGIEQLLVCPLYPQYSSAASGSSLEKVYELVAKDWNVTAIQTLPAFYDHPAFIDSFAKQVRESLLNYKPDMILFSYHGLPFRHCQKSTKNNYCEITYKCCEKITNQNSYCYRAQCHQTSLALSEKLQLRSDQWMMCFQSRLGKTPWIQPYTDDVLKSLAKSGKKKILVVCPAFVADCLETLEEIAIRAKEDFVALGGEDLRLTPSLNAEGHWVENLKKIIQDHQN